MKAAGEKAIILPGGVLVTREREIAGAALLEHILLRRLIGF
jgi:hypothetical protein